MTLTESTSPSGLLTASLDAARRQAAVNGAGAARRDDRGRSTRPEPRFARSPGSTCSTSAWSGAPGVHGWDPLRLSIDVRGTGTTGTRVASLMHELDDINLELVSENVIVAVFGIGENAAASAERLVAALRHAVDELGASGDPPRRPFAPPPPWGRLEMAPRRAFLGPQEAVPFADAVGRLAAESLAAYPPGIPNVLPGERLTQETVDYINAVVEHGGWVSGAVDREPAHRPGGGGVSAEPEWGVDSEHGRLLDVLVCPPDNFRWLATSAISRATLEAGHRFDPELAARQHAEMVDIYEAEGVRVHRLEPDPALPYQVFARDSSVMTPGGAVSPSSTSRGAAASMPRRSGSTRAARSRYAAWSPRARSRAAT